MGLVNEMLKFQRYYMQKHYQFLPPKCGAKIPYNFSAKNTATNDFVSAIRLNKSLTKDALNNWAQVYNGMFEGADRMTGYLDLHCLHRPVCPNIQKFLCIYHVPHFL